MRYYPIFLRVEGRPCLVIGGGEVAERKIASLLAAGARVTVVSPALTPTLAAQVDAGRLSHHARRYRPGDLKGFLVAYAATNDEGVHAEIARDAAEAGVLLNVVDRPQQCDFVVPSVLVRGDLTVAVSTGGGSPALARKVRQEIEEIIGPEYEQALAVLSRLRARLRAAGLSPAERRRIFHRLLESDLVDGIRQRDVTAVERTLARHVGDGLSLSALGVDLGWNRHQR